MGWLGWTEEQALSTDVNAICVAMQGRVAMLRAIFGGSDAAAGPDISERLMTPELFDAVFG